VLTRAGALLAITATLAAAAPVCSLVPGWTQRGPARTYQAENLFEYMDGNAEGYLLYGFVSMQGVNCEKDGVSLVIDVSDFGDADSAYGMFSANRDPRRPLAKVGAGAQILARRAIVVKGGYYLEIAANPEGDHTALLQQWSDALAGTVEGSTAPPAALSWFPVEKQQSLRLIPESVLGIRLLKRGYLAQYEFGKAFVASDDAAAELFQKLKARYTDTAPAAIGDEGFQATDRYLGRLCFFRKGRWLAGYANVAEGNDPAALAGALAAKLP
jgi:hypothetical protein